MRVLICGIDGYLGWPLAWELLAHNHQVIGLDNYSRRRRVRELGADSLTKIYDIHKRNYSLAENHNFLYGYNISLADYVELCEVLVEYEPDAIVDLAEMPSAPWSMISRQHCLEAHETNVGGTINLLYAMKEYGKHIHLLKLGTMGEYGTPNVDIPEGFFKLEFNGRSTEALFPRSPGSWYHLTKAHDTLNIIFACKNWGLCSTDVMQGVVFGVTTPTLPKGLPTRFDYDECFGTAINRFCSQIICGSPLTVYGKGQQTRGWLPLQDSVRCMRLAIENPPQAGEYRTFNQLAQVYSVNQLAGIVKQEGKKLGLETSINHIGNPRMEMEEHYYNPICDNLRKIGYVPSINTEELIGKLIEDILPYKDRVDKTMIMPIIKWRS